jgi:hypothetical protein
MKGLFHFRYFVCVCPPVSKVRRADESRRYTNNVLGNEPSQAKPMEMATMILFLSRNRISIVPRVSCQVLPYEHPYRYTKFIVKRVTGLSFLTDKTIRMKDRPLSELFPYSISHFSLNFNYLSVLVALSRLYETGSSHCSW